MKKIEETFKALVNNFPTFFAVLVLLNIFSLFAKSQIINSFNLIGAFIPSFIDTYLKNIQIEISVFCDFFAIIALFQFVLAVYAVAGYKFDFPKFPNAIVLLEKIASLGIYIILIGNLLSLLGIFDIGIIEFFDYSVQNITILSIITGVWYTINLALGVVKIIQLFFQRP